MSDVHGAFKRLQREQGFPQLCEHCGELRQLVARVVSEQYQMMVCQHCADQARSLSEISGGEGQLTVLPMTTEADA